MEKHAGEPLLLFTEKAGENGPRTVALQIHASSPSTNRFHKIELFETDGRGSSHSSQPHDFSRSPTWEHRSTYGQATLQLRAKALPETNAFRIELRRGKTP